MTNEIKPVYQEQFLGANKAWVDITPSRFKCLSLQKKPNYEFRILYPAAAYEALQKENAELKELLGRSLESLKNDCKTFADCRPRPYSMSQAEQEAWFSCWNSIYDDINNLDLSKYAETKKAVL